MSKIHYKQVVAEIGAIVAMSPERIYEAPRAADRDPQTASTCLYAHKDGVIGCLIGQWLYAFHDATYDTLLKLNPVGPIAEVLKRDYLDVTVTDRASLLLYKIQMYQDQKIAWGPAFFRAIRETTRTEIPSS